MTPHERLGNNVRDRRLQLGMTQRELAEVSGYTEPNFSHLENGRRNPRMTTMLALAKALKTTVADLSEGF